VAAYAAWQAADDDTATREYQAALKLEPGNRDALLGLAALARRQGRYPLAKRHYETLLNLDPRDAIAIAGLMALQEGGSALDNESHLKMLLRQQPRSPQLHFSLGMQYVAQSRWADAQQAFFEACRYAPDNADYAFNLAVSLDHLGQQEAAASYYGRAIGLADGTQQFDVSAARQRLGQLADPGDRP